jgi:hypothetical protein
MTAAILARAVTRHVLTRIEAADGGKVQLRILGFKDDELAAIWNELFPAIRGKSIEMTFACQQPSNPVPGAKYLSESQTCTQLRSSCESLILLEATDPPDAQSLRRMARIDDLHLMSGIGADGSPNSYGLIHSAWMASGGQGAPPAILKNLLELILHSLQRNSDDVHGHNGLPLRRWLSFLLAVCGRLGQSAVDQGKALAALGASLPALELFPDSELGIDPSDKAICKRIQSNSITSDIPHGPDGKEWTNDDLHEAIDRVTILNSRGEAYSSDDLNEFRTAAHVIVDRQGADSDARSKIQFSMWIQIFGASKSIKNGLGAAIAADITTRSKPGDDFVSEWHELDIEDDLDHCVPEAADRLIEHEAKAGKPSLIDWISPRLRQRVERLAGQTGRPIPDLLRAILETIARELPEGCSEGDIRVRFDQTTLSDGSLTCTFRTAGLIWRNTLAEISAESEAGGWNLILEPDFPAPTPFSEWIVEAVGDDGENIQEITMEDRWRPLSVVMEIKEEGGSWCPLARFSWEAESASLAWIRTIIDSRTPASWYRREARLDEWFASASDPQESLGAELADPGQSGGPLYSWLNDRNEFFTRVRTEGISSATLLSYAGTDGCWSRHLVQALECYAPGAQQETNSSELARWLRIDSAVIKDSSSWNFVLLGSHPLRLRWLGEHLSEMRKLISKALANKLSINSTNGDLFFRRLATVSPHRSPPVANVVGPDGRNTLLVSTREIGGNEIFGSAIQDQSPSDDWLATIDDYATDELASLVREYLASHPFKRDGLRILAFLRTVEGTTLVERLSRSLKQSSRNRFKYEFVLIAPTVLHGLIAERLAMTDGDVPRGSRLLPDGLITLLPWADTAKAPDLSSIPEVDLAIVPNFFGTQTRIMPLTCTASGRDGGFRPWKGSTTHQQMQGSEAATSVKALIPERGDPLLDQWH